MYPLYRLFIRPSLPNIYFQGIVYSLIMIQIGKGFTFLGASQFDSGVSTFAKLRAVGRRSADCATPLTVHPIPGRCTSSALIPLDDLKYSTSEHSLPRKAPANLMTDAF